MHIMTTTWNKYAYRTSRTTCDTNDVCLHPLPVAPARTKCHICSPEDCTRLCLDTMAVSDHLSTNRGSLLFLGNRCLHHHSATPALMRIDATIISSHMGDVYSGEQNDLRFFPRSRQGSSPIDCQCSARARLLHDNGHGM